LKNTSSKFLLVAACATFLVSGFFNGAIGPVLDELSQQTGSSLSAAGAVITFLFIGALISQLFGGPVVDRIGLKPALIAAFLLLSAGLFGFSKATSLPALFFFFLIAGLGQGSQNLGINLVVAKTFPDKSTSYLNLLHFFFGFGAFVSPALVSLAISLKQPGVLVQQITAVLYMLITLLYLVFYRNVKPEKKEPAADQPVKTSLYHSPLLWLIGFMLLVYVGVEYGVGSWSTTLMKVTSGWSTEKGALITSVYWGLFTVGRLSGAFLGRKLSIQKLLILAISGALLCSLAFTLLLGTTTGLIIALVGIALFLGPIFPTSVSFATSSFSEDQGKAFGLVGAMSSIGGLSLPLLDGFLLEQNNAAGFGIFNSCVLLALMVLFLFARKGSKSSVRQIS
jgi:fucose permease